MYLNIKPSAIYNRYHFRLTFTRQTAVPKYINNIILLCVLHNIGTVAKYIMIRVVLCVVPGFSECGISLMIIYVNVILRMVIYCSEYWVAYYTSQNVQISLCKLPHVVRVQGSQHLNCYLAIFHYSLYITFAYLIINYTHNDYTHSDAFKHSCVWSKVATGCCRYLHTTVCRYLHHAPYLIRFAFITLLTSHFLIG